MDWFNISHADPCLDDNGQDYSKDHWYDQQPWDATEPPSSQLRQMLQGILAETRVDQFCDVNLRNLWRRLCVGDFQGIPADT